MSETTVTTRPGRGEPKNDRQAANYALADALRAVGLPAHGETWKAANVVEIALHAAGVDTTDDSAYLAALRYMVEGRMTPQAAARLVASTHGGPRDASVQAPPVVEVSQATPARPQGRRSPTARHPVSGRFVPRVQEEALRMLQEVNA